MCPAKNPKRCLRQSGNHLPARPGLAWLVLSGGRALYTRIACTRGPASALPKKPNRPHDRWPGTPYFDAPPLLPSSLDVASPPPLANTKKTPGILRFREGKRQEGYMSSQGQPQPATCRQEGDFWPVNHKPHGKDLAAHHPHTHTHKVPSHVAHHTRDWALCMCCREAL